MSKPGQRVLAELRKLIASGELAAGERIVEIPTAERLQVSRMPVRIAHVPARPHFRETPHAE
ncbi:GntR family transcriptional regulator, partial [Pseudomonas aeruginosa]|uniref:GntR family transcriptional regulator n=1 Tax=Pseudomonas aeruginosa TaxID=287 RepID=UPI003969B5C4